MSTVSVELNLSQWASAPSKIQSIIEAYAAYQQVAHDLDYKEMKDEEDRLRDQMDSGMFDASSDDLKNFYAEIDKVWQEACQHWATFVDVYYDTFYSGVPVAGTLHTMKKSLDESYESLGTYEQTLANSQIGTQWKGEGAEGYAKQIPVQVKAMSDLKQATDATRYAMEASSMVQQAIYLSIMNSVKRTHLTLQDLTVSSTDDRWAERIYTMRDLNKGLCEWLRDLKDEDIAIWAGLQQDLLTKMADTEDGYAELSSGNWPAATAASTGYTPSGNTNPGAAPPPVTPPVNDPSTSPGAPSPINDGGMSAGGSQGQQADEDTYE